ncbi:MAG: hypothetical protein IPK32_09780 [Verrucomicrobiaceae bacterium]|nr:hypothetical protein [Verrucomicrobiaceae bacterium]
MQFVKTVISAIALLLSGTLQAKDHHAYHSNQESTLSLPWQALFDVSKTETVYYPPALYDETDSLSLVGQVVDELMITITFAETTVPALSEVTEIRYGDEIIISPKTHDIRSRVQDGKLYLWYGFHDKNSFSANSPKIATKSEWQFRAKGKQTVRSVKLYVSWHPYTESEMPSLFAYDSLRRLRPSDSELLKAESPFARVTIGSPVVGNEDFKKLVVLIHGWNPDANLNHYAPQKGEENKLGTWRHLAEGLMTHPAVESGDWKVCRYDWSLDAATGPATSPLFAYHANAARDAATAHALKLGQSIGGNQPTHVHFIAHSAGNWMARRAAAYLKAQLGSSVQIQITCLDPFVNDDLGLVPMFEMCSGWTDRLNNCWLADPATDTIDGWRLATRNTFGLQGNWTSGDFVSGPGETPWQNLNIEVLGESGFYFPDQGMKSHGGPVSWYGQTCLWPNTVKSTLFDRQFNWHDGFIDSLACRFSPNDNFPGEDLGTVMQGSRAWMTPHASREGSEPIWSGSDTLWASWTAPVTGQVALTVVGSRMSNGSGEEVLPTVSVYQGTSATSVTEIGSSIAGQLSPQGSMIFNAIEGQVYRFQFAGYNGATGKVYFDWGYTGLATPPDTPVITTPTANQTVTGTVAVNASATAANAVEFYLDGIKQATDNQSPFTWAWDTTVTTNGSHQLSVKSFNGQTLVGTSASVVVNVNNTIMPVVDVDEPNDRSAQATGPLVAGVVKTAKINSPSDVDWYRFEVNDSGTVQLRLDVPGGNDYDLELYGSQFSLLAGSYKVGQYAGMLDPAFNSTGEASIDFDLNNRDHCRKVLVQNDGMIIVGGYSSTSWRLNLARFRPDGTLDNGFGVNGKVMIDHPLGSVATLQDTALQGDGKLLLIGGLDGNLALTRLLQNGAIDTSFGNSGYVITDFGRSDFGTGVSVQSDGKIVVVGYTYTSSTASPYTKYTDVILARYLANGELDTDFGTLGKVYTDFGSNDYAYRLKLLANGKIVVVGENGDTGLVGDSLTTDFIAARYLPNGGLDTTFGAGGKVETDFGNFEAGQDLAVDASGNVFVAGSAFDGASGNVDFAVIKYLPNGQLDSAFGNGGLAKIDLGARYDSCRAVTLDANGQLLLAGAWRPNESPGYDFAVLRLTSDGILDFSFGDQGVLKTDFSFSEEAFSLALQADGKIVVGGDSTSGTFVLARYTSGVSIEGISFYSATPGTYYARVYGHPAGNGSFSATDPYTLSYTFTPGLVTPTHALETIASNGTVQRSNPGPNHSEGQTVTLTPVPNPGFQFAGWSGDASGTANPLTVSMSTDKKIVASFTPVASTSFQGNVTVNLEPPEAVAAGAQWRLVSDGVWRDSGATAALSTQGIQTVEFKTTTGYFSPGKQTVSVNRAANDLRLTGAYRLKAFDTGSGFLDVGDFPPTLTCIAGQSASLTVQAAGTGTLTYQWFLGAYPVVGATSAMLVLTDVQTSLVGEKFSCVVSNGTLSRQTNGCELITLSPPILSQLPASASAPTGGAVSFSVAATGTSPFRYQWKKAGTDIVSATGDVLRLTNLQASDAASYTVVVSNDAGSATSNAAALTVNGPAPAVSGNDSFAGASLIADAAITQTGNNANATREAGEPLVTGTVGGHSLWWKGAAPSAGRVTITTEGSNFDTTLSIYIGNVLNALALVAEDDDSGGRAITSTVSFDTVAGQTYNIAVDGHDAADTGDIQLRIDLSPSVSAPAPATAIHEVLAVMGQSPLGLKPQALAQHTDGSLFVCYGDGGPYSFGSIVKHNLDGTTALIHAFTGADGSFPNRIIRASDGNFYGTTLAGGANNIGGLFKVTPSGDCTLLTSFTTTNGYDSKWIMEGGNGFLYLVQRSTSSGAVVGSVLKCSKSAGVAQVKFYQVSSTVTNGQSPVHLCQLADDTFALTCATGGANSRGAVRFLSSAGVSLRKVDLTTEITTSGNALGLVQAPDGLLYGTSRSGGANSAGTIFSLNTTGVLTALYAFPSGSGTTNSSAVAPPVLGPDGKIYGVTYGGGANGLGSAYAYEIGVGYSLLTSFTSTTAAGRLPVCLARGSDGNLYGASAFGGQNNTGAIFGLSTAGVFVFTRPVESSPGTISTRVSQTSDGTLYWMTNEGGPSNYGQVWKKTPGSDAVVLVPLNGTVSNPARSAVLLPALDGNFYFMSSNASGVGALVRVSPAGASARVATFTSGTSGTGTSPQGYLVQAADGTFYGTASAGGTNGEGTIFKYTTAGGLVALASMATATTGRTPTDVVLGGDGNLYAISTAGAGATGAIFSVTPSGTTTPVFVPTSTSAFGSTPRSLSIGEDGLIYASTSGTGTSGGPTVFEVTPAGSTRLVGVFSNATTGSPVEGPLAQDDNDDLFGTAPTGGNNGEGTLFKLSQGGAISVLHHFDLESGNGPQYGVIRGADGDLYGSTYHQYGVATIYRVTYLPPEIISTSPSQAVPGATVAITGKHFARITRVLFGNLDAASFTVDSNTQITAVVPASFQTGLISVTNSLGTGHSAANFTSPALTALQTWRDAYFGTAESTGTADDLADPEGDGAKNLMEFAFGMNPFAGGQQDRMPRGQEVTHSSQRYLAISFRRRIGETSIQYEVQESQNLSDWTVLNVPAQQVGVPINNGDGTETVTVRATVPMSGLGSQPKCFLRVAVIRIP